MAQVRYYYKLADLSKYTDKEILKLWTDLQWARQEEGKEETMRFNQALNGK